MQRRLVAPVLAALLAILALGLWVRVGDPRRVRDGEHIQFADGDSYYHLRRIEQTLAAGFSVPMFDPWLSPTTTPVSVMAFAWVDGKPPGSRWGKYVTTPPGFQRKLPST